MKGKTKLAFAFVVLAILAGSFFVFASTTEATSTPNQLTENDDTNTRSYSACGGIEGCRTSCGCGCLGNPNACGCGG